MNTLLAPPVTFDQASAFSSRPEDGVKFWLVLTDDEPRADEDRVTVLLRPA